MVKTAATARWVSNSSVPFETPTLLMIDDDRITRAVLQEIFTHCGYRVMTAENGEAGLRTLLENPLRIDAVILDREMPGLNGSEVVARMKNEPQFASIPVIMLTGTDEPEKIQEGIDAGVYYYLIKPVENTILKSVVGSALRERQQRIALVNELNRYGSALKALRSCQIAVRTLEEVEDTACFLASCFPDPERVVGGLMELLVNAVEHGNLGITYEGKRVLIKENRWNDEINRRVSLPENAGKSVEVIYQYRDGNYLVQITDCGAGFDWKKFWHIDPARATASHGRGIARARMISFDRVSYNDKGNSVTVMVSVQSHTPGNYAW